MLLFYRNLKFILLTATYVGQYKHNITLSSHVKYAQFNSTKNSSLPAI